MHRGCLPLLVALTWAFCGGALAQDLAPGETGTLADLLLRAADGSPDAQAAMENARARLDLSLQRLEQFLADAGEEQKRQWFEYLSLPLLRTELDRQQPSITTLALIADRFYDNERGLELPAFVSVRRALRMYL